jgi:2-C-methyl-D-erythritol 4-phosphate cytidylyltransferase
MNSAIIVAAGRGSRFGGERPKQFLDLAGKPVIVHALEKFEACDLIDEIVLVLSDDGRTAFESITERYTFTKLTKLAAGGSTRAESVRNGLKAVDHNADIVAVHDGARPLVTIDEIERTVKAAVDTGAACLVAAVTDTIKRVENGKVVETVDRGILRRALTPQAFRYDVLHTAADASGWDVTVTDECYMVEKLGVTIRTVEGDARNVKITTPEDLVIAETLLRETHV